MFENTTFILGILVSEERLLYNKQELNCFLQFE